MAEGEKLTGGCQCGAVRFRVGQLGRPSVCHCRMCQKAFGSFFGPLVPARDTTWTRGEPKWFRSSNVARRGFCGDCGTPLAYETEAGIELAIGALDDPSAAAPVIQFHPAARLPFIDALSGLPAREETAEHAEHLAGIRSYQHPDHDTPYWEGEGGNG